MARFDFGVADGEFRQLTFRQFTALHERWQQRERFWDLRAGVLASVTANFSMNKDPDRPPLEPSDFFPSLAQTPEAMTDDQILAGCLLIVASR